MCLVLWSWRYAWSAGLVVLDRGGATFVVGAGVRRALYVQARVAIVDRGVVLDGPLQQGRLAEVLTVG